MHGALGIGHCSVRLEYIDPTSVLDVIFLYLPILLNNFLQHPQVRYAHHMKGCIKYQPMQPTLQGT